MADIVDLFTWAAAEDAKSAARDAEHAANEAKEKAQELIELHQSNEYAKTVWLLNKMLQDLFYDKEVAYYNLARLKTFVHSQNSDMNCVKHDYRTSLPPFPAVSLILGTFFGVWGFNMHGFWSYPFWIMGVYSFWKFLAQLKEWNSLKKGLPSYLEEQQKKIDLMYYKVKVLKNLYPMLSLYGISTKSQIDSYIQTTYEALLRVDDAKAKRSLRTLYGLLMDIEVDPNDEKIVFMMYDHSKGLKRLVDGRGVFCKEALGYYNQI